MANNLNLCQFIGNLGDDPEVRFMPNGDPVANLSIACNWKGKDKEGTEWIRIVAFGKLAEIMQEYLKKGSKVYVSGRMRTRSWEDDQGVKRYATEVVASQMEMLDRKPDGGERRAQQQYESYQGQPASEAGNPASGNGSTGIPADVDSFEDSDIPF